MDPCVFSEAMADLPLLFWDTALPLDTLTDDRPYRNIGDLLIKRSPIVRDALRLCGCDGAVADGLASDYESFAAFCLAAPLLSGHPALRAAEALLYRLFGLDIPLSPYVTEALWTALNQEIEKRELRPAHVVQALNVESVCYRLAPDASLPTKLALGCDLYPILDLSRLTDTAVASSATTAEGVVDAWAQELPALTEAGCVSARILLPRRYRFLRNSRKREVDEILLRLRRGEGVSDDESNALVTALMSAVLPRLQAHSLVLLLETEADAEEVTLLFEHLTSHGVLPEILLITRRPEDYLPLCHRFIRRTPKGLPSLLAVSDQWEALTEGYPLGLAVLPFGAPADLLSLAGAERKRQQLAAHLATLEGDPESLASLAEDVVYGNIKNRFGI